VPLESSVASALRSAGEAVTVRRIATTFNTTTQTSTVLSTTNVETYAVAQLIETGVDGVSVKRGDLEVWLAKVNLDLNDFTPAVGDYLIRGSQVLVVLDTEVQAVAGYYRLRARAAA
jgi:hypothetical protein